jgi:hypothetical protein
MSTSLRALRSAWLPTTLAIALATTAVACGEGVESSEEDVTDVKNTAVKNQSIGNCWVYATSGWAESLHLTHTAETLNISESWLSYWHWYEQIAGAPPGQFRLSQLGSKPELSTGGWHGLAVELMRRYGVIDEGKFIPEEAEAARSSRQSSALNAINASLKSGALSDPQKRRDRKLVRQELDKAWGLSPATTALIDQVFGQDVSRTLYTDGASIPVDSGLRYPKEIPVGRNISLADAIGTPASTWSQGFLQRKGKYAWNEVNYPTNKAARRDFLRRTQKAMHAGMPVIMTWFVDFAAMDSQNRFMAPPATPGRQGGHMTVVEDYQINNVPGYGTLKAGELVTDPVILEAALAPEAQIEFIRIKNSWGTSLAPNNAGEEFRGYHDLYMPYLDGPIVKCTESNGDKCGIKSNVAGLTAFVLPPDAFITDALVKEGGSCAVNLCATGPALSTAACPNDGDLTACIELVCEADDFCCNNEWDDVCVQAARECGLDSCQ